MSTETREIAYEREGDCVGLCPCCGVKACFMFACDACFQAHYDDVYTPLREHETVANIRDAFYRRGVELRAAGKMAKLKAEMEPVPAGRWVTDPKDDRIGRFACCGHPGNESSARGASLTSPFYELTRWHVKCAACMLAEHGAKPPEAPTAECVTPRAAIGPHTESPGQPVCELDWCQGPIADQNYERCMSGEGQIFCSSNCADTHADRLAATTRRDAFVAGKRGIDALAGEVKWAEAKTAEEIETIRRRWRALSHESAVGNEGVFPVLEEEVEPW